MDVTAKFYALANRSVPPPHEEPEDRFRTATAILVELDRGGPVWHLQESIELVEREFDSVEGLTETERCVRAAIVTALYEKLKAQLQAAQDREIAKLQRESRIDKYFQPELHRRPLVSKQRLSGQPRPEQLQQRGADQPRPAEAARWSLEAMELLAVYEQDTDHVVEVRRRVCETSAMLSVLSSKAVEQQEVALSVLGLATDSIGFVESAESQLRQAQKHNAGYKFYLLVWFCSLSSLLWVLHLVW